MVLEGNVVHKQLLEGEVLSKALEVKSTYYSQYIFSALGWSNHRVVTIIHRVKRPIFEALMSNGNNYISEKLLTHLWR